MIRKLLVLLEMFFVVNTALAQAINKTCLGKLATVSVNMSLSGRFEFEVPAPAEGTVLNDIYGPGRPHIISRENPMVISIDTITLDDDGGESVAVLDMYVEKWFNHRDWSYTTDRSKVENADQNSRDRWERCYYQIELLLY